MFHYSCVTFKNPLCQVTTTPSDGKTGAVPFTVPTTSDKLTTGKPTLQTVKPSSNVTLVVNGTKNSVILRKLKHFSDYTITVRPALFTGDGGGWGRGVGGRGGGGLE